jgi:hypothetical protein
LLVALAALPLVACGVPLDETTRTVPMEEVPYGLLNPPPPPESPPEVEGPGTTSLLLYLLDDEEQLVPTPLTVEATGLRSVVRQLLEQLADGPTEAQRDQGLASALGADVELSLDGIDGSTARVEVSPPTREPAADRLPLAVGQVVLTLTSVEGVECVLLVQDGEPTEMALPGGARTSSPAGAVDYRSLVVPGALPAPKVAPVPTMSTPVPTTTR